MAPVIVLVEDDPDDVFFTTHALVRSGLEHEIVVARDAARALDLLLPGPPGEGLGAALVLLDLNLPGMSGFEILRRLRADPRTIGVPIIVFTGNRADEHEVGSHPPPIGYTRKPLSAESFRKISASMGLAFTLGSSTI